MARPAADIVSLLGTARAIAREHLECILESHCLLDADLAPRRETLEEECRPEVERLEKLIAGIDTALDCVEDE